MNQMQWERFAPTSPAVRTRPLRSYPRCNGGPCDQDTRNCRTPMDCLAVRPEPEPWREILRRFVDLLLGRFA